MIKSVRGLKLGDKVNCGEETVGVVTNFPTRYSVCLKNQKPKSGSWSTMKISRLNIYTYGEGWFLW